MTETQKEHQALLRGVVRECINAVLRYPFSALAEREKCLRMVLAAVDSMDVVDAAAAPAQAEPSDDARDAARWRALLNSQRGRPLGNAGVSQPEANHYAHLGLELWTIFGKSASTDRLRATLVKENALGREWLTKYADIAIESQKNQ